MKPEQALPLSGGESLLLIFEAGAKVWRDKLNGE
jgi:hypothetical protein